MEDGGPQDQPLEFIQLLSHSPKAEGQHLIKALRSFLSRFQRGPIFWDFSSHLRVAFFWRLGFTTLLAQGMLEPQWKWEFPEVLTHRTKTFIAQNANCDWRLDWKRLSWPESWLFKSTVEPIHQANSLVSGDELVHTLRQQVI